MNKTKDDLLHKIFEMQIELNNYIFVSNNICNNSGEILTMYTLYQEALKNKNQVNQITNTWLKKYQEAIADEVKELKGELLWKWWSKNEIDLENIQIELIDILHFLISAMICTGLTPETLFNKYKEKHEINKQRQDEKYK